MQATFLHQNALPKTIAQNNNKQVKITSFHIQMKEF
jgi:hypothetical protein